MPNQQHMRRQSSRGGQSHAPMSLPGRPPPQRQLNSQKPFTQKIDSGDDDNCIAGLVGKVQGEDTAEQGALPERSHTCVALALEGDLIELVRLAAQCLELLASQSIAAVNVMIS